MPSYYMLWLVEGSGYPTFGNRPPVATQAETVGSVHRNPNVISDQTDAPPSGLGGIP